MCKKLNSKKNGGKVVITADARVNKQSSTNLISLYEIE